MLLIERDIAVRWEQTIVMNSIKIGMEKIPSTSCVGRKKIYYEMILHLRLNVIICVNNLFEMPL